MRLAKPPQWLDEPRESTIRRTAQYNGLNNLTEDDINFVYDAIAMASGGALKAPDYLDREQYQRHQLLNVFKLSRMPGSNDVVKAVRLLRLIQQIERHQRQQHFYWYDDAAPLIVVIEAAFEVVDRIDANGMRLLLLLSGKEEGEQCDVQLGLEIAVQSVDVSEMFRIAQLLNQMAEFQTPQGEVVRDPNGEDVTIRSIEELSELPRASQQGLALPRNLMRYRAVTGELSVRQPVTRRNKKQLLYFLIDSSGSMRGEPIGRAAGVVINALERVIKGEAEIYLRFFDEQLGRQEYHADNPDTARQLFSVVTNSSIYSGGGTNFIDPLRKASERVHKLLQDGMMRHPEVIMVTDGVARIPSESDLNGLKLNVVQVGNCVITELADLATISGGINVDATTE